MLRQIAERTGGRILSGQESGKDLFAIPRSRRKRPSPSWTCLLILLACLIPLDVGVRRVQLDWSVIRGWFGAGRKTESTETLGALLKLKEEGARDDRGGPQGAAGQALTPAGPAPRHGAAIEAVPRNRSAGAETERRRRRKQPASTTERLLADETKTCNRDDENDDTKP